MAGLFAERGEVIILFGGGDGGGVRIVNGRFEKIPPFNPEMQKIIAAAALFYSAQTIKQVAVRKPMENVAQGMIAR